MMQANKYIGKFDQHIKFIEQIIQKPSISGSVKQELSKQIERIKKRCSDRNLYLAVIGEFSSGKSTFINALLRDDLLKTSALVATATATKITYSDRFAAEALFKTRRPKQFIENPEEEPKKNTRKSLFSWIGRLFTTAKNPVNLSKLVTSEEVLKLGISPKKFVQMVTSEEELARALDDFKIYHPANFIRGRIVIIDTPGANADIKEHGNVTQTVVQKEADAAVIVIPANQPVSETLVNFLSGPLYQYIHRCVFIITKMDTIRPKEQSRLIKTIQKRLKEKLKIEELFLLEAAPQIVIDICTEEEEVDEKLKDWNDKFRELEKKLREYLASSREIAIAESVSRLLTQVFRQSESHLKEQQEQFRRKQEAIEREVIRDLQSFTSEQYAECSRMIENTTSQMKFKVNILVKKCRDNAESKLNSAIYSTKNKDELKTILKNQVPLIFGNARSNLDEELKAATDELSRSFGLVKEHFDKKFSQQYSNLQALSTTVQLDRSEKAKGNLQVNTYNVISVASELSKTAEDASNIQVGLGAGAGATIGTIILPGVGTVLGAAIGSLMGGIFGGFFGPSLNELQNRSWNELQPKIKDYFDSAEIAVEQSLEVYSQKMINTLNKHIDIYIETYRKIVNVMQQEQKEKKEDLNRLQQDIQADLLEINNRIRSLEITGYSTLN